MEGMSAWTSEELAAIAGAQELEVAARRGDGSLRKAVPISVVRAGDDLFVRAAYGPGTGWHRAARAAGEGRIRAGGVEKDVTFEAAGDDVNGGVDAAYVASGRWELEIATERFTAHAQLDAPYDPKSARVRA